MKKILFAFVVSICFTTKIFAQVTGDTIVVNTFNYNQTYGVGIRDSVINFPNLAGITFEKIYMTYNMRCKGGVVGNSVTPQGTAGCGEWDYNCQTYITDSTKTDSTKATAPSHIITGFSGTTYNYTTNPTYTYYKSFQKNVVYNSTISENLASIGTSTTGSPIALQTRLKSGKSQFLYTASELSTAGLTAGDITSIKLNIINAGTDAKYLKIKLKATTKTALSATSPDLTGFTEVYYLNTAFVNGINQFKFYKNFTWNGIDNLIVEYSFTNTTNTSATDNYVISDAMPTVVGLATMADDYNVQFTGANPINMAISAFVGNITNQISVSFWSNGDASKLPGAGCSALWAGNAQNQRQLNVHLPWSDSKIYWDCGNNGNYDRISNTNTTDFKGVWSHWTFTKNTTTGVMNIYLNGNLWLTGTGKTFPFTLNSLLLGCGLNKTNPYFGKMDDFAIWNKELTATDVQNIMYVKINSSNPNYTNLMAYYKMNEATGTLVYDSSATAATSTFTGPSVFNLFRGNDLFKNFEETNTRPSIVFVQGVYAQTINTITVLDSTINTQNTVYSFISQGGNIVPFDTNTYYQAGYSYIYNGDSTNIIDSVNNATLATINITQLNYFIKSPSKFQIMSFVTPYGNGLDLGVNGKTWTFDVSDYAPILKGAKRMTMEGGGQWQEDMDIKFIFIVGTPPRNILNISNIWKVESVDFSTIYSNAKYEPRNVLLDAAAKYFKIRSAITGHGQDGEFTPETHFLNLNNASTPQYLWDVWKPCASNPIYPQGGTWIYNRAGWCPGIATKLQEINITPLVTPGANVNIDYGISTVISGQANYWVSNQLVTYGNANFALDAAIVDIKNPSSKIEYARTNYMCMNPLIVIKNTGSTALTSATIEYWVNNNSHHETYNWTGNLAFTETTDISLPTGTLWTGLNGATGNIFHCAIKNPNNGTDAYIYNNTSSSVFNITSVLPNNCIMQFKTNNVGTDNRYYIIKEGNDTVFRRENMMSNTMYRDSFKLGYGCYSMQIFDDSEDGLSFWANTAAGTGSARLTKANGAGIITFQPDFGASLIYNFTVDFPMSYEELMNENEINIYPNPANKSFYIDYKNIDINNIYIMNQLGQKINLPVTNQANKIIFNSSQLSNGLYYIIYKNKNATIQSYKIAIEN